MKEMLKQILDGQKTLFKEIQLLKSGQEKLEEGQARLWQEIVSTRQEMGTKEQQNENTAIIKALLHNQEETNAKLESLALTTATRDHAERQEAKIDHLNLRLFNQEAELTRLKAVK